MWNWKEAAFLSSVSRYLGVLGEFTSDLEYFALLSFVGRIGTFLVSTVSGEQDCHQVCYVCFGQPALEVVTLLSLIICLESIMGYVGSGVTPTMRTRRCFEHSTCGCLVRVM